MPVSGGKVTRLEIQNWHLTCSGSATVKGLAIVQTINGTPNISVPVSADGTFGFSVNCGKLSGQFIGTTLVNLSFFLPGSCTIDHCSDTNSIISLVRL